MSEVVRQRLESLFEQLQVPVRAESPQAPLVSSTEAVSDSADGDAPAIKDERWLARLRQTPTGLDEPTVQPELRPKSALVEQAVTFGREHLATVVVVLMVAVSWTAYSLLQTRSTPVADAAPVVAKSPALVASPGVSPASVKKLAIHVIGAVAKPGLVTLPDGSRVADAITAAGGLTKQAKTGELNLAQTLVDGTQLKIGTRKHPGGWLRDGNQGGSGGGNSGGSGSSESSKISLNKATLQQLDTLPGIGPVTAQKVIDWRTAHGKFTAITELQEVDGIGPKTYADLAGRVRL